MQHVRCIVNAAPAPNDQLLPTLFPRITSELASQLLCLPSAPPKKALVRDAMSVYISTSVRTKKSLEYPSTKQIRVLRLKIDLPSICDLPNSTQLNIS